MVGEQYATYLESVANYYKLPVYTGVEVQKIETLPRQQGFLVQIPDGVLKTRFLIWAAGEQRSRFSALDLTAA
jgi:putative flavoprotein involved in K+ transport